MGLLFCFKPSARTHRLGFLHMCYNKQKLPFQKEVLQHKGGHYETQSFMASGRFANNPASH